jgi:ATPase subunit of ABC transporter with duplicated ATPase domains
LFKIKKSLKQEKEGVEMPSPLILEEGEVGKSEKIPAEQVNESLLGRPTVIIKKLVKSFGSQLAVNNLSFNMYANQIFCLLGHNGAGKVRCLCGLFLLRSPSRSCLDYHNFYVNRLNLTRLHVS